MWSRLLCSVLFFKQKTAYELRISDWSSDVFSSDREIAIGLGERRHLQLRLPARLGVDRLDLDILDRDDARQRSDAADEIAHLMVITHHDDAVGNFRVELLRNFALWLEQPFFQNAGDARLRDVIEQIGDFGTARQLIQHGAERALHFAELFAIRSAENTSELQS